MPLTQHLEELRWRLVRALIAIGIGFVACYNFADFLFELLTRPLLVHTSGPVELIGTGVTEAFFTKLKVSLIAAIFLASPVIFHQAWLFVAPGLYDKEKLYARPFVLAATAFFVIGATFCYVVVFPVGYAFFVEQYATIGVQPAIRISEYLSFSSRLLLAFGITFELPVVSFFLARLGFLTAPYPHRVRALRRAGDFHSGRGAHTWPRRRVATAHGWPVVDPLRREHRSCLSGSEGPRPGRDLVPISKGVETGPALIPRGPTVRRAALVRRAANSPTNRRAPPVVAPPASIATSENSEPRIPSATARKSRLTRTTMIALFRSSVRTTATPS